MPTTPLFSNCFFGAMYLTLRGKVNKWVLAPGGTGIVPFHASVLTKKNHLLNFYRLLPHEENTYGGWWFWGSFRGITRSKWRKVMGRRGKLWLVPPWVGILYFFTLLVPWVIGWALFSPYWAVYWACQALRVRFSNRRQKT